MAAPQPDTVASIKNGWACSPYGETEMVEVLEVKHAPILTERQKLIMEWDAKQPFRDDYADWFEWSKARSLWMIDKCHALERFDRRKRWAREGIFCEPV